MHTCYKLIKLNKKVLFKNSNKLIDLKEFKQLNKIIINEKTINLFDNLTIYIPNRLNTSIESGESSSIDDKNAINCLQKLFYILIVVLNLFSSKRKFNLNKTEFDKDAELIKKYNDLLLVNSTTTTNDYEKLLMFT